MIRHLSHFVGLSIVSRCFSSFLSIKNHPIWYDGRHDHLVSIKLNKIDKQNFERQAMKMNFCIHKRLKSVDHSRMSTLIPLTAGDTDAKLWLTPEYQLNVNLSKYRYSLPIRRVLAVSFFSLSNYSGQTWLFSETKSLYLIHIKVYEKLHVNLWKADRFSTSMIEINCFRWYLGRSGRVHSKYIGSKFYRILKYRIGCEGSYT